MADTTTPRLFIETLSPARAAIYRAHYFRIVRVYGTSDMGIAAMKRLDAAFGKPPNSFLAHVIGKPFNRERFAASEFAEREVFAQMYITTKVQIPNYLPGFLAVRQAS